MKAPMIGITTYHRDEKGDLKLPFAYADAVRRAGGIPLLIPPGEERVTQLLDWIDGLILSGGGDVDPALYGAQTCHEVYWVDEERDRSEIGLIEAMLRNQKPLFCICRGFQLLNVALGGSLITHIPSVLPDAIDHRQPPDQPYGPIEHGIDLYESAKLANLLGTSQFRAASWHHQALDHVAPDLRVVARAEDGIIEAVEMKSHPNLLAVQWHPEITAARDPLQQRLFDQMVAWAR